MSSPTPATPSTAPFAGHHEAAGRHELAGHRVARVGYGAMQLERLASDPAAASAVLRHAIDVGVNHLDTADFYGAGFVNEVIRKTVGDRDDVLVATKVGAAPNLEGPIPLRPAQRPEELRASVRENLRQLGRDRLDLVYLRRLEAGPGLRASGDQDVSLEDQLEVLLALRDAGDIGELGISAVNTATLRLALSAGIAAVQNAYSLVDREFEDMLRLTVDERIAWVPFFPLGSAFPGHAKVVDQPAVIAAAARFGVTPSQVGLAWLMQRAHNVLLIPGTTSVAHLNENNAAAALVLDAATVAELDALVPTGAGEIQWVPDEAEKQS